MKKECEGKRILLSVVVLYQIDGLEGSFVIPIEPDEPFKQGKCILLEALAYGI
jgi:hypothetical protein